MATVTTMVDAELGGWPSIDQMGRHHELRRAANVALHIIVGADTHDKRCRVTRAGAH